MFTTNKKYSGLMIMVPSIFLAWGLSWPFMKTALDYISPLWMGSMRMMIGGLIILFVLFATGKPIFPQKKDWKLIVIISLLQMVLFTAFLNIGLRRVEASHGVILLYTTPLWVAPLAVLIFKEKLAKLTWIGLFFGFCGLVMLLNPFSFDWSNKHILVGCGFVLLSAFSWAFAIIYIRLANPGPSSIELVPWQLLFASLSLALLAIIFEPHPEINWSWQLWACMAYLGPIATAFGFWCVIELSCRLSPVTSSMIMLGAPVIGFISSALILNETLTFEKLMAVFLLLVGLICIGLAKRDKFS